MALPSSGTIKMSQVRDELKKTGPISLGNADVRKLGGKPSGTIKMSDLYGKSAEIVWVFVETMKAGGRAQGPGGIPSDPFYIASEFVTDGNGTYIKDKYGVVKWENGFSWNASNQIGFIGDKKYKCICSTGLGYPYWMINVDVYKPQ